jgi:hypothetical protein
VAVKKPSLPYGSSSKSVAEACAIAAENTTIVNERRPIERRI